MLLGRNLRSAYERVAKNRKSSSQDEQDSMSKNDSCDLFRFIRRLFAKKMQFWSIPSGFYKMCNHGIVDKPQ